MQSAKDTTSAVRKRITWQKGLLFSVVGAFGLFLIALVLTGQTWEAVAYAVVVLFGLLFALAIYFWGSMLFGGVLEVIGRQRTPVSWAVEFGSGAIPEYDLDPGLELLAAGVLAYRYGEVKPHVHFMTVPMQNVRAIRPFVVARTGSERTYHFDFVLTDEQDRGRFDTEIASQLHSQPQLVMPHCRLIVKTPKKLIGQRWNLQVRSGVTVVTSLRFSFVADGIADEPIPAAHQAVLPRLLDSALKQDAMTNTQEIILE